MKLTLSEIESAMNSLSKALTQLREARRVAKLVYGDDNAIKIHCSYAWSDATSAIRTLEGLDDPEKEATA